MKTIAELEARILELGTIGVNIHRLPDKWAVNTRASSDNGWVTSHHECLATGLTKVLGAWEADQDEDPELDDLI